VAPVAAEVLLGLDAVEGEALPRERPHHAEAREAGADHEVLLLRARLVRVHGVS
jgi:hypothetical protein